MWPPLAATTARHRRVIDPMMARGRFGVTDIAARRKRVIYAARVSRKEGRNFSSAARNFRFTSSQKPRRNLTVSNRAWEIPLCGFGAVGCGPLPVEEAVAGGAAGKGSEVNGVALEGAAAPAGGAVAESGGSPSGVATTGGDASDAMAKAAETLVRTRAWRTLAGPHRKTRGPQRIPAYPLQLSGQEVAPKASKPTAQEPPATDPKQQTHTERQFTTTVRPTHGQHTVNTRPTYGQHDGQHLAVRMRNANQELKLWYGAATASLHFK